MIVARVRLFLASPFLLAAWLIMGPRVRVELARDILDIATDGRTL